jgi:GxxExxY protein
LSIELAEAGLRVQQQAPITVSYRGTTVGEYYADLWVEERIIVEIKAVEKLHKRHEVQLVNYLTATGVDVGLLLNFGRSVEVKRKHREYRPKENEARLFRQD